MVSSYVGENAEFERQYLSGELEVELTPQVRSVSKMLKCSYKIVLQSKGFACVQKAFALCGGLTLTGLQVPTKT